jgi:hypothetical protein
VLYAYDGFADLAFAAGEVKDPQRTLPRAIIGGTLAIIAIYLAANLAYLYVNPIERLAQSPLIAADTMQAIVGRFGVAFVSVVVTVSTFGALIGIMLTAPRVFFAMADEGLFFPVIARVHPRYHTPYVAISLAALLGIAFVLTRTFEQLSDTFVLSIWPFYGLAVAGLYRLRRRTDLPRPYKVPGYPVLPAVFHRRRRVPGGQRAGYRSGVDQPDLRHRPGGRSRVLRLLRHEEPTDRLTTKDTNPNGHFFQVTAPLRRNPVRPVDDAQLSCRRRADGRSRIRLAIHRRRALDARHLADAVAATGCRPDPVRDSPHVG